MSNIPEDSVAWLDITALAKAAAGELASGHMLHADSFNLGDSMSALEMMDPKMDAGLPNSSVKQADECFRDGLIPLAPDLETKCAVMDRILACELSYHGGSALPQTIYTCLYMHKPEAITDPVLRSYVLCTLKCCHAVKRAVTRAEIYEEEDFRTNTGGFSLQEKLTEQDAVQGLTQGEEQMIAEMKEIKAEGRDGVDAEIRWINACLARMRLRRGCQNLWLHLLKGFKGIPSARKSITYVLSQLPAIEASLDYDQGRIGPYTFQPALNMKMMAPSPPRTVNMLTVTQAIDKLKETLSHIEWLCNAVPCISNIAQLEELVVRFTTIHPHPQVVARTFMRLMIYGDLKVLGQHEIVDWVKDSLVSYRIPREAVESEQAREFIKTVGKLTWRHCNSLCFNLGRQRRRVIKSVDDWSDLQTGADELDINFFLSEGPQGKTLESPTGALFSSWLLDQIICKMTHWMNLGFHLRLYQWSEYSMMFWYLDYFHGIRMTLQDYAFYPKSAQFAQKQEYARMQLLEQQQTSAAGGKGVKKKGKESMQKLAADLADPVPSLLYLDLELQQHMCRGMFRIIAGMERDGIYTVDELTSASLPLRFHRRFSPVMRLQRPPALVYEHYSDSTDSSSFQSFELYIAAGDSFASAKAVAAMLVSRLEERKQGGEGTQLVDEEWLNEVRGFAKVAAANHTSALVLQTRAMLKIKGGDTKKLKSPSGSVGEGPRRPFAYPCDDPVVKANSGLSFDFEVSPLFPEVLPTM